MVITKRVATKCIHQRQYQVKLAKWLVCEVVGGRIRVEQALDQFSSQSEDCQYQVREVRGVVRV